MKRKFILGFTLLTALSACIISGCGEKKDTDLDLLKVSINDSGSSSSGSVEVPLITDGSVDIATINFNGISFKIGDKAESFIDKLGAPLQPSESIGSCILAEKVTRHVYGDMILEVRETDNTLGYVKITPDNDYSGEGASITGDLCIGMDEASISAVLPQAALEEIGSTHLYKLKTPTEALEIACRDGVISTISINVALS